MKKITLLTATALTIAGLGGQTLVAQAAPNVQIAQSKVACITLDLQSQLTEFCGNGYKVIVSCFPSIQLPGVDCPEVDVPETDAPEVDIPEIDAPETDAPDVDAPEVNVPETDAPENNTPGNNGSGDNNSNNNGTEDTTPDESPEEDSSDNNVHAYVKEVIDLVNAERAKEGLSPLTMDLQVQAAAQVRAMECEQLFSHTRPNGTSFATALQEQNVSYRRAGENIAWGQRTPQQVVTGWMNSEGHRANIMNPGFTTIGVGYYQNANGTNYWCQLFTN